MTFFCVLNPDIEGPFDQELRELTSVFFPDYEKHLGSLLNSNKLPQFSHKYAMQRNVYWAPIHQSYHDLAKIKPDDKMNLEDVLSNLNKKEKRLDINPLSINQGTAFEDYSLKLAEGKNVTPIANDGTNCCVFLCLKIAQQIADLEEGTIFPTDLLSGIKFFYRFLFYLRNFLSRDSNLLILCQFARHK